MLNNIRSTTGGLTNTTAQEAEDGEVDDAKKPTFASEGPETDRTTTTIESKLSRGTTKRDGDANEPVSRSSTPRQSDSKGLPSRSSSRLDADRSIIHAVLPVRPEVPIPPHSELDRHRSRLSGRGDDLIARHDRASDSARDRNRDSSRRGTPDVPNAGSSRPSERSALERDGYDSRRRGPRGDLREERDGRDGRSSLDPSRSEPIHRREGDVRNEGTSADSSLVSSARLPPVDPGRAALITGSDPRAARGIPDGRASARPLSPRSDRQAERDDRIGSTANHVPIGDRRDRLRNEPVLTPSGPRGERQIDRMDPERPRDGSVFSPNPLPPPSSDPDHGRLSRPPQEPSYGRLNQAPEPPSGPRGREVRGGPNNQRNTSGHGRGSEARESREHQSATLMNQAPPTGPSSSTRGPRATTSMNATTATTAAQKTPLPGMHPSRAQSFMEPPPPVAHIEPGIHPSRLNNVEPNPRPHVAPVQTAIPSGPTLSSAHSSGPPSGPRGARNMGSNNASSPTTAMTPTGPSSSNDNGRDNRRRFQGLQNIIGSSPGMPQQAVSTPANERVMSIKGRGNGRKSIGGVNDYPPAGVPPPPPGLPPPSAAATSRDSVPENRDTDLINPERLDRLRDVPNLQEGQRDRDGRGGGRGRESGRFEERGGHGSRRSSRERSPRRDRTERSDRPRSGTEGQSTNERGGHRDSRGGRSGRDGEKDGRDRRHGSDRNRERGEGDENWVPDHESGRPRDVNPRENLPPNNWQRGRNGGGEERSDRRSGGREPRSGDGRRDSRPRGGEDGGSGRKRTSEEGGNGMSSEREKRPRR